MKVLIDMNLSTQWIAVLEAAGIPALHWSSIGDITAADDEIMLYARRQGYLVLTSDLDFSTMLTQSRENSPSVVQIRAKDHRPEAIGEVVVATLRRMQSEGDTGVLVTVSGSRARFRLLPFPERP